MAADSLLARASAHPCLHCLTTDVGDDDRGSSRFRRPSRRVSSVLRGVRRALLTATATTALVAGSTLAVAHPAAAAAMPAAASAAPAGAVAPSGPDAAVPAEGADVPAGRDLGPAYWLVAADGGVFSYGNAAAFGALGNRRLNAPIVGGAAAPAGQGYWLVAGDGGMFAFGEAGFFGSTGGIRLNSRVVNMAATPSGAGYWLVAADGGVFAFGDAGFYGSTGSMRLNSPIVSILPSSTGRGYSLIAADGGVFAFGDAPFYGSTGGMKLNSRIVTAAVDPRGAGYWLFGSDGGVFAFGGVGYHGSLGGARLNAPIVSASASWDGRGYSLVSSDGGVFAYGSASFLGGMAGRRLNRPVVAILSSLAPSLPPPPASLAASDGYDISWPQCNKSYPGGVFGVGIVGVNGGRAFTSNPCLADQYEWASSGWRAAGVYMNLNGAPAGADPYGYGASAVNDAFDRANWAGARSPLWWLDVETMNWWSSDRDANAAVVRGAIERLHQLGLSAGIYSTSYQWGLIAGGYSPGVPIWVAGAPDAATAAQWCNGSHGFAGGETWMVQTVPGQFDYDIVCDAAVARAAGTFDLKAPPAAPIVVHVAAPAAPAPAPVATPKLSASGSFKASE